MKKLRFNQLRGTHAQKLRHRICIGFTLGSVALSALLFAGFSVFAPPPTTHLKIPGQVHEPLFKRRSYNFLQMATEDDAGD